MFGMKGMGDMMKLFSQREKIMENVEQAKVRARARTVVGESGAGMVKVTSNGMGEIISVAFDPEALKDPEALGSLVAAAANLALVKSKELMAEEVSKAMGGIELPPGLFS
jgi:DNA-binding YbaB/EbfC family protein